VSIGTQCPVCVQFRVGSGMTCDAFPEGIPPEIATGRHDHTKPYPGDGGIRFEPTEAGKEIAAREAADAAEFAAAETREE
jgi:hypothetical protein